MAFVEFKDVKKVYHMGEVDIHALRDVNFEIEEGEFCVIVGASGAGKTTILNILGGMDTLSEGKVILDGKEISAYNQKQLTSYRRYDIGSVSYTHLKNETDTFSNDTKKGRMTLSATPDGTAVTVDIEAFPNDVGVVSKVVLSIPEGDNSKFEISEMIYTEENKSVEMKNGVWNVK